MKKYLLGGLLIASLGAIPAFCNQMGKADFVDAQGKAVGQAVLTQTEKGVLIKTQLFHIPEGWHAFHVHGVGQCNPPEFKTAGGHYNPHNKEHGYENPNGSHAGDLPNVFVGNDGVLNTEVLLQGVTVQDLLDKDGSAIVLHSVRDDYKTDPAGNAGARIACGVIQE